MSISPPSRVQAATSTIYISTFQPFPSRLGVDVVMRLWFTFSPALVARLKALLAVYAVGHHLYRVVGGWLPEHRVWFIECDVWEVIKLELLFLGYRIVEDDPQ